MVNQSEAPSTATSALGARHVAFADIVRFDWDRLLAATPAATPFSRWTFHRAWWDAYGAGAAEDYLAVSGDSGDVRGIVPLMRRAGALLFGASYHADYATVLAASTDLAAVSRATARAIATLSGSGNGHLSWQTVDLRRLRAIDGALPALEAALSALADTEGWRVTRDQEDVCPVVAVQGPTWDDYLATLAKSARHEIRRKLRRAADVGELSIAIEPPTPELLDEFIALHQRRFGAEGLFGPGADGQRDQHFIHRLGELERSEPDGGILHVARVRCGQAVVFSLVAFDDGATCWLYNAGINPDARSVSPGITGAAMYLANRIAAGRRRFDWLRGAERYKYEWGAVDEPIYRLLVERTAA